MYFSSDCFLESVGNCQPEKFVENRKNIKVSPHFGVSVPYFHGRYSEGHFEVRAMSGRGSTVSERYLPTTNEKPSETMFQRVLLDFVLKTFGLGAENETRTRDPNLGKVVLYQLSYFRKNIQYRQYWTLHQNHLFFERKTRLELATPTLARLCSTN